MSAKSHPGDGTKHQGAKGVLAPGVYWLMKLFGEALEKGAPLCYTFRMKYAERSQGNAYHTFTSITRWA